MCQLTWINLHNEQANKHYLIIQSVLNSEIKHKDGWGFFTQPDKLFKTKLSANRISNIHEVVNRRVTDSPIISHVRNATSTNKATIVKDEFSHPFESEDFILAHNGSLALQDGDMEKYGKEIVDSEIFLKDLQGEYEKNKEIPFSELLDKVMKTFYGKFAFLIFKKDEEKFFAARGTTAELNMATLRERDGTKLYGYIINTEKPSLELGLRVAMPFIQDSIGKDLVVDFSYLARNSLFELKDFGVEKIGDVIQNEKIKEVEREKSSRQYLLPQKSTTANSKLPANAKPGENLFLASPLSEAEEILYSFGLLFQEIDMFWAYALVPICYIADEADVTNLVKLTRFYADEIFSKHYSEEKEKIWKHITAGMYLPICSIYDEYELEFPYFLNTVSELENAKEKYDKEMEEYEKSFRNNQVL